MFVTGLTLMVTGVVIAFISFLVCTVLTYLIAFDRIEVTRYFKQFQLAMWTLALGVLVTLAGVIIVALNMPV